MAEKSPTDKIIYFEVVAVFSLSNFVKSLGHQWTFANMDPISVNERCESQKTIQRRLLLPLNGDCQHLSFREHSHNSFNQFNSTSSILSKHS